VTNTTVGNATGDATGSATGSTTSVADATGGPGTPVVPAAKGDTGHETISDGDLPTRMLVLGVAHHDGSIRASEVFAAAETCGRSPEQVRSCLRRLVGEGLFTRVGVGQRAVYRPTEAGLSALAAGSARTRLAYVQDASGRGWDGCWHLVAFAIPEARRAARDSLRDHLGVLGGAAVHNGLYVSPHPWEKDVLAEARRLGVSEHVSLATSYDLTVGGVSDPVALAARLWDVHGLAERYRAFVARWSGVPADLDDMRRHHRRLPDSAFLPGALAMGLAFRACFEDDPLLPPELLPRPWPGREARDLLVRSRRLALRIRADHGRPALFRTFDDLIDTLP
jgi:phenylacetic acid degradation operon negative regulatory protein